MLNEDYEAMFSPAEAQSLKDAAAALTKEAAIVPAGSVRTLLESYAGSLSGLLIGNEIEAAGA